MRSYSAVLLLAAAASVTPALAAPISYTSDLEVRGDFDALEVRELDNNFARRELQEELFARALNDELVARSKIGRKIGNFFKKVGHGIMGVVSHIIKREDMDVLARELGIDEEIFAREVYDGLEARNFEDDVLFARDFGLDEDLFARDLDEDQFVARALDMDEQLVARSKIGRKIGNFFKKVGHGIMGVVSHIIKREDAEVLARELGVYDELFARSFDDYEPARRDLHDELITRMLMEELDARGVEETGTQQHASHPNAAHSEHPHAHEANSAAHPNGVHHTGALREGAQHSGALRNQGTQHRHQTGKAHQGHDYTEGAVSAHHSTQQHQASQHFGTQEHHSTQHQASHQTREDVLELLVRAFGGEFDELD